MSPSGSMRSILVSLGLLIIFATVATAAPTGSVPDPFANIHADILRQLVKYGLTIGVVSIAFEVLKSIFWEKKRRERKRRYNEEYLQSDDWNRKRYMVLKRDHWTCVYCGRRATQVHHKRYARVNIGKEPIEWLVSVCARCHEEQHG